MFDAIPSTIDIFVEFSAEVEMNERFRFPVVKIGEGGEVLEMKLGTIESAGFESIFSVFSVQSIIWRS